MKFVGEIGIQRREYLYELDYIDMVQIERGYERRHRHAWSIGRWQTFHLMAAFCGGDNLRKSGINGPADLLKFPWDTEKAQQPEEVTDDVVKELQDEMAGNPWIK